VSSFNRNLGRGAVVVLTFVAMSVPSVAGASTGTLSASSTSAVSTAAILPLSGTAGPYQYWIAPTTASFQVGTTSCIYNLVETLILPVGAACTVNGHTFGAYLSNGVFVPILP
jgi:hypothetical protein